MEYLIDRESALLKAWSRTQYFSPMHWFSVILFALITFSAFFNIGFMLIVYGVFFLVTALPRVFKILIFAVIIGALTAIFPPLGIILTIIFFIMKIGYVAENWKALFAGILVYAYPFVLIYSIGITDNPFSYNNRHEISSIIVVTLISALIFHFLLVWLYRNKFSTKNALGTMGAAPLFFIMLILPFIIQNAHDIVSFDDFDTFEGNYQDPGTHWVDGHYRSTPSGGTTYVDPYLRTNPDGIESNNFSYKK